MDSLTTQMIPVTEIADTLSFGLIGRLRKRIHSLEDNVQLIHHNWNVDKKNINNLVFKNKNKFKIPKSNSFPYAINCDIDNNNKNVATNTENKCSDNIITAAYNFNSSIIPETQLYYSPVSSPSNSSSIYSSISVSPSPSFKNKKLRNLNSQHIDDDYNNSNNNNSSSSSNLNYSRSKKSILLKNAKINENSRSKSVKINENSIDLITGKVYKKISNSNDFLYENDNYSNLSFDNDFTLIIDNHIIPGK